MHLSPNGSGPCAHLQASTLYDWQARGTAAHLQLAHGVHEAVVLGGECVVSLDLGDDGKGRHQVREGAALDDGQPVADEGLEHCDEPCTVLKVCYSLDKHSANRV